MAKSLVIVESPVKAKTINKFLGSGYIVKASGGHVIDLPEKEIGVDIENGFKPNYTVIKGKTRILNDLKKTARQVDSVLLATDPDREGEAIAWHVANAVVSEQQPSYRILFNQITRDAVRGAIENKTDIDLRKVNAQQARRILDRLVGYKVSPFLWRTVYKGLSAGRVQSVALRIIVERDAEIEAFVPEEYWKIMAVLVTDRDERFEAELVKKDSEKIELHNEAESSAVVDELRTLPFEVDDITVKNVKRYPQPPFITSTLQQEAARRLGFSVSRTMKIAQNLYEGIELVEGSVGLITYMRTDSTRTAPEAIHEVRSYIRKRWDRAGGGYSYLPGKPTIYKTRKGAQDAHEAIRPASVAITPDSVKSHLDRDQYRLYELIWKRFVASQMSPAESTVVTTAITAGPYGFRASASRLDFDGFLAIYSDVRQDDEETVPAELPRQLKQGDALTVDDIVPSQHFTKPSPYYTEASLVREMETLGIGRPSTYAQVINTIQERRYVHRDRGKLKSTELGRQVTDILVKGFPDLFNVTFTAAMEEELDKIESGEYEWLRVMDDFYGPFSEALAQMNDRRKELKKSLIEETDEVCEKCGSPMIIRWGKNGRFVACSAFPKCRNTRPLEEEKQTVTDVVCEKCGAPMVVKNGRYGRFLTCSNYPGCQSIKPYAIGVKCPREGCDGDILEKKSRRGKLFYGCSRYPGCKFASWTKPVNITCRQCGSPALVESKNGKSLTCPRCHDSYDVESMTV